MEDGQMVSVLQPASVCGRVYLEQGEYLAASSGGLLDYFIPSQEH